MINMTAASAKEEWVATVTQLLAGVDTSLSSVNSILKDSSVTPSLVRLTNNLIQVTCSLALGKSYCLLQTFRHDTASVSELPPTHSDIWVTFLLGEGQGRMSITFIVFIFTALCRRYTGHMCARIGNSRYLQTQSCLKLSKNGSKITTGTTLFSYAI